MCSANFFLRFLERPPGPGKGLGISWVWHLKEASTTAWIGNGATSPSSGRSGPTGRYYSINPTYLHPKGFAS